MIHPKVQSTEGLSHSQDFARLEYAGTRRRPKAALLFQTPHTAEAAWIKESCRRSIQR
jgi:hypothetical protein